MSDIREIAIIDDDATTRAGLARLVESIGLHTTTYPTAEAFLVATSASQQVDCVVTDMRMPGMSGLQLQEELATRELGIPLIVLTGFADVSAAVRSMKAGAFDFIEKPCSPQILLETVSAALKKSENLRRQRGETLVIRKRYNSLTPRERQVMALVVAGTSNKRIAMDLKLSEKTVEFHRANVMTKMRSESVQELVRMSLSLERSAGVFENLPSGTVHKTLGNSRPQPSERPLPPPGKPLFIEPSTPSMHEVSSEHGRVPVGVDL